MTMAAITPALIEPNTLELLEEPLLVTPSPAEGSVVGVIEIVGSWEMDGLIVGLEEGTRVGFLEGVVVGRTVGLVGAEVGSTVGFDGLDVGCDGVEVVGTAVGELVW